MILFVAEYVAPDLLADLGVTEINRWCDGSFGYVMGVILHAGCRVWFD